MKNKKINFNGYALGEALYSLSLLGILAETKSVAFTGFFAGTAISLLQAGWGRAKVTNNSDSPIFCKAEDSDEVSICPPHSEKYDIDGFVHHGKLYKVPDGVHASVSNDGVCFGSIVFAIYNIFKNPKTESPGEGWGEIFKYVDK